MSADSGVSIISKATSILSTTGSLAALLMSATGPVAAGSLVAVCQSIGATGEVSAITAAVANTSLAVVVVATCYAIVRKLKKFEKQPVEDEEIHDEEAQDESDEYEEDDWSEEE
ncbi:uncharacterized protein [Apostichopus japonicus]|uniref:uncharacterized protein isoform X2 n=1 Tax=Stichopus japonicus TaxID=307972 RepID=UPI003AB83CDA